MRGVWWHDNAKNVEIRVHSEDEAWVPFKNKVNDHVLHLSDIEAIAKDVARECDGVPLVIITVG